MLDFADKVKELLDHIISEEHIELVEIEIKKKKRGHLLRVFIDKPGGVTLGDCENVSEQLGRLIEVEDVFPESYVLEVSSPGIDRPIKTERDFKRCIGRLVNITASERVEGKFGFVGEVLDVTYSSVLIKCESENSVLTEIPFSKISKAFIEIRF